MFINSVLIKNVNLSKHTPFFFIKLKLKSLEFFLIALKSVSIKTVGIQNLHDKFTFFSTQVQT